MDNVHSLFLKRGEPIAIEDFQFQIARAASRRVHTLQVERLRESNIPPNSHRLS